MTQDELKKNFDSLRDLLKQEIQKNPTEENQKMAGALLLGIVVLESALLDLKRIADATERSAANYDA